MKIQCVCGSKFAFDVTPDMASRPIQFTCPSCALDLSTHINALIRQELGVVAPPPVGRTSVTVATLLTSAPAAPAVASAPPPVEIALPPPQRPPAAQPPQPPSPVANPAPAIRISITPPSVSSPPVAVPPTPAPAPPSASAPVRIVLPPQPSAPVRISTLPPEASPTPVEPPVQPVHVAPAAPAIRVHRSEPPAENIPDVVDKRFCPKHTGQRVTEQCVVCGKGICPLCMRMFGYLCSPHCKEKAELQGIDVPVYAGQRDVAGAREWRKTGLIIKLSVAAVVVLLGVWFWFEWFGSRPKPVFAVRFEDEMAKSGQSALVENGQIVFIHGDKLARYDIKSKKQVWMKHIVDKKKIAIEAAAEQKRIAERKIIVEQSRPEANIKVPSVEAIIKSWEESAEQELELRVYSKNIWVAGDKKLTRYDWESGEITKAIPFEWQLEGARGNGDEITLKDSDYLRSEIVRKVNLVTGEVTTNSHSRTTPTSVAAGTTPVATNAVVVAKPVAKPQNTLPPGQLDPQKLAAQLAGAPITAKLAAPATLSNARNQQRLLNELEDQDSGSRPQRDVEAEPDYREYTSSERSVHGEVFLTEKLVEHKIIAHNAMKAPPKKSALDGPVNVTQSMEVANDILNEWQREAGLDKVFEDQSRYSVKVRDAGTDPTSAWQGEVVGPPRVLALKTVNVLIAGTNVIVFDKTNKKKWQAALTHQVSRYGTALDEEDAPRGLGPVVERGDTFYVFDAGVLSAYDMANGNARWRLPSIGVSGLFFDGEGSIYVNTTTASPEKLKFSRQINVNDDTHDVLVKLDEKSGKELWKAELGGAMSYLKGKYIYMMASNRNDEEEGYGSGFGAGLSTPSFLRIRRINPKNGRIMWEHFQQRGPLDIKFDRNNIQLVFKKEVQVLSYISF